MELRSLGKTKIQITPIGTGTWQFSEAQSFHKFFWKSIDSKTRDEIVKASIDGGINWFDTAEIYGNGRSERGLSQSLQANKIHPNAVVIATKWNPVLRTAKSIKKTIGKRIENLAPYSIDLFQIHNPTSLSSIRSQIKAMANLLEQGLIKSIGVSNFSTKRMSIAAQTLDKLGIPLASNQMKYSIIDRSIEYNGVLDFAKEWGITIIAYSPLEQGLATGKFHENLDSINNIPWLRRRIIRRKLEKSKKLINELKSIAETHNATIAQISLSWLTQFHGDVVVAIPGASKKTQAEQNAKSMNIILSREELNLLDDISQLK